MHTNFILWSRGPTHAKYQLNSLDFVINRSFMQVI